MSVIPLGRVRRSTALGACLTLGVLLTGCGDPDEGTNGVGKLEAPVIQSTARRAAAGAATVRLSGTVVSKGRTYRLDMRLKKNGGTGSVRSGSSMFRLLRVGEHLFLKADAAFWRATRDTSGKAAASDDAAARKLDGMYVRVPEGDPAYKQLSGFTQKDALLDGLLTLHGTLDRGDHVSVDGTRTIEITGDKGAGGSLDVSLQGTAYPVLLKRAGGAGTLRMTDWDKPFALKVPADNETVDYGKQLPTS